MKIGIEAQRIFRRHKHGMDIVALELLRNLQQHDHENQYVIFARPDEDSGMLKASSNLAIVEIPGGPYPYWEQVLLPRAVREHKIDVLHCTSNTAPLTVHVPVVLTLHDIIYLEKLNLTRGSWYQIFGNLYRRWNVPAVVPRVSKIITVSDFEHRRIQQYFNLGDGKLETVYNGVGKHFRPITDEQVLSSVRRKYALPSRYVFFLGNTDPKKNVIGVLKALAILEETGKLDFALVMPDIDRSFITKLADEVGRPDILTHIHFTGYIPNEELPAIYGMASVFLYPSLRESFGIPILEAMACGTPVITSATSSMPEVAADAALLVNPSEPREIAEGILRLMTDPALRNEFILKGKSRAEFFSWEKNAQQTLAIYREVVSRSGSGSRSKNADIQFGSV